MKILKLIILIIMLFFNSGCSDNSEKLNKLIKKTMLDKEGAIVFIDIDNGNTIYSNKDAVKEKFAPCSTFKIWNSLIGIESGIISSSDKLFYIWDGKNRSYSEWNKDLNLKQAFQVSCVPAFQNLARRIGTETMQEWIDKLDYGNGNISSGIDIFWLPRKGKEPILISPEEQSLMIKKLITEKLPFGEKSRSILKDIMLIKSTKKGTLYGKTGSGFDVMSNIQNKDRIGWFVGYIVNKDDQTYAFSCLIKGKKVKGSYAKAIIEDILIKSKLL